MAIEYGSTIKKPRELHTLHGVLISPKNWQKLAETTTRTK